MLRTIFFSLWACGMTAGALFLGLHDTLGGNLGRTHDTASKQEPTFSQPIMVFVPVLSKSQITGYLFSNVSVLANTKLLKETTLPLNLLVQDSYLTYLAGNKKYALPNISKFDENKLKQGVKKQINHVTGKKLVEAVYMSDINYLDIREVRGMSSLKLTLSEKQPPEEFSKAKPDK